MKSIFFKKFDVNLWMQLLKALLFSATLCMPLSLSAENTPAQQNNIKKKISKASSNLKNSRSVSAKLERNVHQAEDKLNDISKQLHSTEQKINQLSTKLNKSNKEHSKLLVNNAQEKDALAQQMQALYTSGKQSHLRLLLKQDDPSDISRTVKYFEYMNKHRLERIGVIKTRLDKIKTLQTTINEDTKTLKSLQNKQRGRKSELRKTVQAKEKALKKQKKIVYSQEQILSKLRKEESRLQGVIERLAQKRRNEERQRKKELAEAKANEQRRTAQKRAELALLKKQQSKASAKKVAKKEPKKAPKKVVKKTTKKKTAPTTTRHYVPNKPFSTLRGKLAWPVKGRITKKYGSTRNSKQKWKGVVLSAPAGTRVHAIARGKVEFSGRLKGYGYLVIIRHDNNYRSLYAYNRSVYKKEGQIVKAGDIIAAVGSSGSQTQSGLYFEIRKGTYPQNPNRWIR